MYNVIAHLKQFYITFILQTIELGSFHVKSRLLQFSSSAISDFDNIFTVYVCVYVCMYLCMYVRYCIGTHCAKFCSNILSILFWQNFKDVRINLQPYSAIRNSTSIADKLMKFAEQLVLVVLIKGCGKNVIYEQ